MTPPAYPYEVRLVSVPKGAATVRPGEPLGRIVAHRRRDAMQEAITRYGPHLAPWQGLALRRIYFGRNRQGLLRVVSRGRWYYHPKGLEDFGPSYTEI